MKNIIIGTAGHIDHGKTTLIKALTNIETDRLQEEKKRGITIDLGFAFFDLPSGKKAGIVDVPGHEKFIKNMLAGVSGIDLVLFVISAEEGVMPQTQEHLDILSILQVQKGIVVLTKKDLVDEDWLDLVQEEIKGKLKGTFLEDAPMVSVSSHTQEGFDTLITTIDTMAEEVTSKSIASSGRMPIDRVFTLQGFGTIVTGTLMEGQIKEGESLFLYPSMAEVKIRSIQVHSMQAETAYAGQRVALNVTGIKKSDINRGDILAHGDSMAITSMLDVKLSLLAHSHRELKNWTRLRLYHGTKEILCRLVLLDQEVLKPGETCFAQLRLEVPTACKYGDHFVVRFYSPLETIGGGIILDPNAHKHKRFNTEIIDELLIKETGTQGDIVENLLIKSSDQFFTADLLAQQVGMQKEEVLGHLQALTDQQQVVTLGKGIYLHQNYVYETEKTLIETLTAFHEKYPLRMGMPKEEVRSRMFSKVKMKVLDEILNLFEGQITLKDQFIGMASFEITYTDAQKVFINDLKASLDAKAFKPDGLDQIIQNSKKVNHLQDIVNNLIAMKELIKIQDQIFFTQTKYASMKEVLKEAFEAKGKMSLAECRDVLDTSRKFIVPILEHFDKVGMTKRVEDYRMLR